MSVNFATLFFCLIGNHVKFWHFYLIGTVVTSNKCKYWVPGSKIKILVVRKTSIKEESESDKLKLT